MKRLSMIMTAALVCSGAVAQQMPVSEIAGISYGTAVSRNEFGIEKGCFHSNSKDRIAVYRKDERKVSEFPLLDISTRTGRLKSVRYPMNGMVSERVDLCVCDTCGNVLATLDVKDFTEERYLTGITWSPDDKYIFVQVLDRSQHHLRLNMYNAEDGSFRKTLLTEDNEAWVEPLDPLYNIKGTYRFIYRTDNRDGYRNLYVIDTLGQVERLTKVDADVEYCGNDGKSVYYTSAEVSPVENHLFKMNIRSGKAVRLTQERGWHNIRMKDDCTWSDTWSNLDTPPSHLSPERKNALLQSLTCTVELGTVKSADGEYDNWYRLVKPRNFDPSRKYPLVVYVYGGPHSQMVRNSWLGGLRKTDSLLTSQGCIVYIQDNRGTQNRGAAYEKAINRQCGQVEMADQMAGIKSLLENSPWIDRDRIGVCGWSYGGFMTISLVTTYPDFFKAAACGGPVIDWKWYEVMYGERYMDTPETNPEGFALTSLIDKAANLKCPLLICQGMNDQTVLPINSMSFVQKCIEEGIQLDYFPYPCSEHNVLGKWREHLYGKLTGFFLDNL